MPAQHRAPNLPASFGRFTAAFGRYVTGSALEGCRSPRLFTSKSFVGLRMLPVALIYGCVKHALCQDLPASDVYSRVSSTEHGKAARRRLSEGDGCASACTNNQATLSRKPARTHRNARRAARKTPHASSTRGTGRSTKIMDSIQWPLISRWYL